MSKKARLKAIETKNRPVTLQAKLPDWLQDDSYTEPVATDKVIKPSGYLALEKRRISKMARIEFCSR